MRPARQTQDQRGAEQPEFARRLPDLYPRVFESLRKLNGTARSDLVALLRTGLKPNTIPVPQSSAAL